jgi:hypothetical protein
VAEPFRILVHGRDEQTESVFELSGAKEWSSATSTTYEPTRMRELPEVEVHIVGSQESPSGIGEPGVRSWRRPFATPSSRPRESSLPMELEVLA